MQPQDKDVNKIMFMHLVSMLAMSAIQQMGKLVNPGSGKAEINLEAAQATIDMLDMLEARTRGNLDAEETRLLKDTLMSLKMNYVETQEHKTDDSPGRSAPAEPGGRQTTDARPEKTGGGTEKQTSNAQRPTPNAESKTGQEANAGNDKTPKYHKKYE